AGGPGGIPGAAPGNGAPADDGTSRNGGADGGMGRPGGMGGGPSGGVMGASEPGDALIALLTDNADAYTWAAATVSANGAAGYQLATEEPVMPIGGFNGSDPSPTLEQFRQYVESGQIHYFLGGSGGGPGGRTGTGADITRWVQEHFTAQEVDGVTVYDLTAPK